MIGQVLNNRYEVQQQLGKKAGRQTLLTRDLVTGKMVIVKLLCFSNDFEWDSLKLFEREAKTLKFLSHPCIPSYLDYFEENSPSYKGFALVQTYIPAQNLEQHLKSGRTFTEPEVKQIAQALLNILLYLHHQNPTIIHRDIKPSNILLTNREGFSVGTLYLVDFGSVQTVTAAEGGTMTVVGTYGYMPPEQFGGRTVAASDLYSLGATLIYLMTGTHPADLPQKDFQIQFEQAAHLSPALSDWLKWMTEPSLEKRLSSASLALQVLVKAPDKKIIPSAVTKSYGSKIKLIKNSNSLDVIIRPCREELSKWELIYLPLILLFLFVSSFLVALCVSSLSIMYFLVSFFLFADLNSFFNRLLNKILALKTFRLRLSHQQIITYTFNFLGFNFNRNTLKSKRNITKLIRSKSQLIICISVNMYKINVGTGVESEHEIEWLAQQLSNWLSMPITRH